MVAVTDTYIEIVANGSAAIDLDGNPLLDENGVYLAGYAGDGEPEVGDVVVHYGNYFDGSRQYVKVRDVIGGGYERYIEGLDSVDANGVEYYFVGRQDGNEPRWFIGNRDLVPYSGKGDGSYIEYINRRFNLNNVTLSVNTQIGGMSINDYILANGGVDDETKQQIEDALKGVSGLDYIKKALKQGTTVTNGLVLSSVVSLGVNNADFTTQTTYSGISGLYDPDKIGGGIAAWYGGDMLDRGDYYDWDATNAQWVLKPGADLSGLRIAKGCSEWTAPATLLTATYGGTQTAAAASVQEVCCLTPTA